MQPQGRKTPALVIAAVLLLAASTTQSTLAAPDDGRQNLLAEKPLLHIRTFEQAPELNGALDDPCWSAAQPATPFWHYQTGEQAGHDTSAKMGIDADRVYVAFRCEEAEMASLKPEKLPPDSLSVFANDHVEFFFMPDALAGPFYHFAVDIGGNRYDEMGSDGSWGCDWQAAVQLGKDAWTVEMRIPRAAIGLDDPQMSLVNFCRTRRLAPVESSAWSKTFGIFHNIGRFGRVLYGPAGSIDFTAATLKQPRLGENHVDLVISGAEEPTDIVVKGYSGAQEKVSRFVAQDVHLVAGAASAFSIPMGAEYDTRTRLVLAIERAGRVQSFCDTSEVALSGVKAAPIRQVLEPEAAPFTRWIDQQRLRGISYGFDFSREISDGGLVKAEPASPSTAADALQLRGESYFRILVEEGEVIEFTLAAAQGDSPFTSSIYAVFGPEGKLLAKGIVEPGATEDVRVSSETAGHHTLLVNSGPASWNPFTIAVRNPCWALDARGKSTYVHTPVSLHSLRDSKLAGMNIALMAAWQWGIPFKDDAGLTRWGEKLATLCQGSDDAGIKLIPYVGWGCSKTDCEAAGDYTRALTRLPLRGPHPCPISREYWERSFTRRALEIARLSKEHPSVVGIGLDPESYYFGSWYANNLESPADKRRAGAIYQPYGSSREKCICNNCLAGLAKSKGIPLPDLPEDGNARFDWIAEHGLLDDLCAYQQGELESILTDVRQRVQEVNPDLCFAVLLLSAADNWFCRGVARGLGTSRVPALDFDESTYVPGYSADALHKKLALYEKWGAHVVHGGCLWAMKHPPANPNFLSAQMFNFALQGHGYWFWPGSMSVWRSSDNVSGYFSLSGYTEDYWKAIVSANQELDRRLEAPDTYRSQLERIQKRPSIPPSPGAGEKNEWAKKPFYPVHVYAGTRLSFVVPPGRKSIYVVWGYRENLGERTLLVNVAGKEQRLTATVEADQANTTEIDVPESGCTGWIELQGGDCVGVKVVGAKPFFGGAEGMRLR